MKYPKERYKGQKPWMDYEWLYNEYITKDRSSQDIANEYGCKRNTIQCWLAKHKIHKDKIVREKRQPKKRYQEEEYLRYEHLVNGKSMSDIARENNVSLDTIQRYMQIYGIDYWRQDRKRFFSDDEAKEVVDLYTNKGMSALQIGMMYGTSHSVVIRELRSRGIHTRSMQEAQLVDQNGNVNDLFYDEQWLREMHWKHQLTCKEIGAMLGYGPGTVRRQMHALGIPTMTNSESKRGRMTGPDHPNWQGGLTPLKALLREYFTVNIAPEIAKRDKYTCQLCGAEHVILNVHHIRSFSEIVNEIAQEHPELDCEYVYDRQKLYTIITSDPRFCDHNNLITFCRECHYFIIHAYKQSKTISSQASYEEGSETIPSGSTSQAIGDGSVGALNESVI